MENIYFNCILKKRIVVDPKYLNENIDNYIEEYLKSKIEGTCIDEGYIKPETIKILKKSVGMLMGSRFTGDITYEIAYTADICNPIVGNIIECKVRFINKLGIMAYNGPINVVISKQFHINDEDLNKININDVIKVEVIAKKFSLNDKEIKIVAKLWNQNDNLNKKNIKKDINSSDLTPIISDNDFIDHEDDNDINEVIDDDGSDITMDDDYDDVNSDEDIEEDVEIINNYKNKISIEDIELDEDEDEIKNNVNDDDLQNESDEENSEIEYD
jgi:DNA-directed RNA polymerase subunit E'/Rpb7